MKKLILWDLDGFYVSEPVSTPPPQFGTKLHTRDLLDKYLEGRELRVI